MIKNYDEALKTLNDIRTYLAISRADDCVEELDKVARYFINEKHKENPTFEQCIKEWEERGYEVKIDKENKNLIIIWNIQKLSRFEIDLEYKRIKCNHQIPSLICYEVDRSFAYVDFEEVHLLSKTIKALEVSKDD